MKTHSKCLFHSVLIFMLITLKQHSKQEKHLHAIWNFTHQHKLTNNDNNFVPTDNPWYTKPRKSVGVGMGGGRGVGGQAMNMTTASYCCLLLA